LKGNYYANIFVHFEPFGYTMNHGHGHADEEDFEALEARYKEAGEHVERLEREVPDEDVPDYVDEDKEGQWRQDYVYHAEKKIPKDTTHVVRKVLTPHTAAALGDVQALKEFAEKDPTILTKADGNGWKPLHEAARSGELAAVKYLVEQGANVNERTNKNRGGNPLFWAEQMLKSDDETIKFLKSKGAVSLAPRAVGGKDDDEL